VVNDRFVVLDYVEATPGPRNIAAIRTLAEAFHGSEGLATERAPE